MAGIIVNRPIGTIKGKSKVNRPWKPKERSDKHNGPTWQE